MSDEQTRLVWDWPLRLFHWALAVTVIGAWLSGQFGGYDWQDAHSYFGFTALGLLIFRVVWGFVGPRHARFSALAPRVGAALSISCALCAMQRWRLDRGACHVLVSWQD